MLRYLRVMLKRLMVRWFERNLHFKLTFILFAALTVALASITFLHTTASYSAIKESVMAGNRQVALRASREIDLMVNRPLAAIQMSAAVLGEFSDSPWKQETVLVEMVLNDPTFIRAAVMDLSGHVIASSELGTMTRFDNVQGILKGVAGSKRYISPVRFADDHTPYTTFAYRIRQMGQSAAVLVVDVRMTSLWETVDAIGFGKTGSSFVVSGDGVVIAHPDKKVVLRNENLNARRDVSLVLEGKSQTIEFPGPDKTVWLSSFAPVRSAGWGVLVTQSAREAYQSARSSAAQAWVIFVLLELIVLAGCFVLARFLIDPLRQLVAGLDRVASGDMEEMMEVTRRDELGKMARAVNSMLAEVKQARRRQKLSEIGEATGWIVHEFKNSLVSIKSFVQLFPKRHKDEDYVRVFSRLMPEEMDRWERLMGDLGDHVSNSSLNIASVDVREVLENLLEVVAYPAAEKKIVLKRSLPKEKLMLEADGERLRQVILNLVINAIDSLPSGGEINVLLFTLQRPGQDYAVIKVSDNGMGIAPERLHGIFEPFHQTHRGMGLGLSVCRKIIRQHEGTIRVDSKPGCGTTVTIDLPVRTREQVRSLSDSGPIQAPAAG